MNRKRPEPIAVPEEKKASYVLSLQPNKRPLPPEEDSASSRNAGEASTSGGGAASTSPRQRGTGATEGLTPDDFEELCVIGQGSSGVAKKVRNRRDGRHMVLKVIQFDVSSDTVRKQVTTELRTLYGADHPNVVRYYAAFFDNGAITIAMEYCDAGSLADLLKARAKQYQQQQHRSLQQQASQKAAAAAAAKGAAATAAAPTAAVGSSSAPSDVPLPGPGLPEPVIAHLARQLVAGLHYLHKELKVVHRDIKPSNLLLNGAGEVKISDFGVSGQLASSVSNCLSWVGTVTYMSPERIKGDSYSFDSDLWSLGLTLLECALGRFPYPPPGETGVNLGFWELLEYIVVEPPPSLPPDQFSSELVDFIAQCLQKDAKARPSVAALAQHPFLKMHPDASLREVLEPVLSAAATAEGTEAAAAGAAGAKPAAGK
ncbi:hypothetical protein GPECTOR_13g635 [Gonium pectorale]|uniref:mitogen-activated protein kinase kinase n=1 Tax=Gonium pectorale TaxID=33097 RepID=A0A150GMZ6_GONPE|nr:hypothetical protein GPECTOR_13g635 [Gonium pectorale]|eukprot:KXZ51148.1 hypothetical protein GPECTOR_13g635 [Gonium pectorale]